jgi:hypothetical protein
MNSLAAGPLRDVTLSIRVSLDDYADATHARRRGNPAANPLSQAMGSQTYFALTSYKRGAFRVIDRRTGNRYFGLASTDLAACMADFEQGEPIGACRSFELALSSDK